jgi:Ala-tRNA(Pro) deacylase
MGNLGIKVRRLLGYSGGPAGRVPLHSRWLALPSSEFAMRIPEFLAAERVAFQAILHAPAYSAQRRARYLHIGGSQVAKAVLIRGPAEFALAVLSARQRLDLDALATHLGGPVRLANRAEAARVFRDCEWGVVPPFGNLYGLATYLDAALAADTLIVLETHTHVEAVRLACGDFERLACTRRLALARSEDGAGR